VVSVPNLFLFSLQVSILLETIQSADATSLSCIEKTNATLKASVTKC
jgi:hypothetical protein